jgi:hypothetical protein
VNSRVVNLHVAEYAREAFYLDMRRSEREYSRVVNLHVAEYARVSVLSQVAKVLKMQVA